MAVFFLRICVLLLCLALLHVSVQSIRPVADADSSLPTLQHQLPQHQGLPGLTGTSEVKAVVAGVASIRRSLAKDSKSPAPAPAPAPAPPPARGAQTDFVTEGW